MSENDRSSQVISLTQWGGCFFAIQAAVGQGNTQGFRWDFLLLMQWDFLLFKSSILLLNSLYRNAVPTSWRRRVVGVVNIADLPSYPFFSLKSFRWGHYQSSRKSSRTTFAVESSACKHMCNIFLLLGNIWYKMSGNFCKLAGLASRKLPWVSSKAHKETVRAWEILQLHSTLDPKPCTQWVTLSNQSTIVPSPLPTTSRFLVLKKNQ